MPSVAPVANWSSRMKATLRPGTIVQPHQRQVELLARDGDVERLALAALDREGDRLALGTADPRHDLVDGLAIGRLAVDRDDQVAPPQPGLLGRRARDDRADDRALGLVLVERDADAHERARQRLVDGLRLIGGQERRVALVADGLGHAPDRAVGEVAVVQVLGVDVVVLDRLPRLLDQREVRGAAAVAGSGGLAAVGAGSAREGAGEHDDREDGGEDAEHPARVTGVGRGPRGGGRRRRAGARPAARSGARGRLTAWDRGFGHQSQGFGARARTRGALASMMPQASGPVADG